MWEAGQWTAFRMVCSWPSGVVAAVLGAGCVPDGTWQHPGLWDSSLTCGWWAVWSVLSAGFTLAYGSSLASCLPD